jgi:hypothetical protein
MQDTNNVFHAPCVPFDTTQILSEAFPRAMDNKEVIYSNNVNWFTLYIYYMLHHLTCHMSTKIMECSHNYSV